MKRHLPNALFVLVVLGLGWATAANITRSVQLSQDPSGPVGFDTQNSIYLPNHLNNSNSEPTGSSLGTSPTITGSDMGGEIILGATPGTAGTLRWRTAYTGTPYCNATTNVASAVGVTPTPGGMAFTHSLVAGNKIYYNCTGGRVG